MKPKKSLGQNFLIDKNILTKIVNLVNIDGENILEIGPGTGNLTNEILNKKPNTYLCIEKDKELNDIIIKKLLKAKISKNWQTITLKTLVLQKVAVS